MNAKRPTAPARNPRRTWPICVVALATMAWIGTVCAIFGKILKIGMNFAGEPLAPSVQIEQDQLYRALIFMLVIAPGLIALVAYIVRLRRTAAVYFAVALILGCLMGSSEDVRRLIDPPTNHEPERKQCLPVSGSDKTCPGG